MTSKKILVVEDEAKLAKLLKDYLEKSGFEVACLYRGDEVMSHIKSRPVDLILLDIMLPGLDGLSVCKQIRAFKQIPIIMLTAKAEEVDRIIGLELGADDYVCKPFSPREVVARVKAVLRRSADSPLNDFLHVGPFRIDSSTYEVYVNNKAMTLTPNEFSLLKVLMGHPNRVFSRNDLVNQVQGYDYEGYDRTVDTHIKNLRKKIAEFLPDQKIIITVYGVGYKFCPPV
ncbi:MAG: response regulator transcription factor [Desulfobacteraceae bacterium]|nr:response regulator transcription factor [Desulfobacteraceae bacterium]